MLVFVLTVELEHAARLSPGVPGIGSGPWIVPVDRPRPGGEREQLSPLSLGDQGEMSPHAKSRSWRCPPAGVLHGGEMTREPLSAGSDEDRCRFRPGRADGERGEPLRCQIRREPQRRDRRHVRCACSVVGSLAADHRSQERRVTAYPAEQRGAAGVLPGKAEHVQAGRGRHAPLLQDASLVVLGLVDVDP